MQRNDVKDQSNGDYVGLKFSKYVAQNILEEKPSTVQKNGEL